MLRNVDLRERREGKTCIRPFDFNCDIDEDEDDEDEVGSSTLDRVDTLNREKSNETCFVAGFVSSRLRCFCGNETSPGISLFLLIDDLRRSRLFFAAVDFEKVANVADDVVDEEVADEEVADEEDDIMNESINQSIKTS